MSDFRQKNLADILVNYSVKVKPGEWVVIMGEDPAAEPLVNDIVEKVLQAGAHPDVLLSSGDARETKLRIASLEQLQWVSPLSKFVIAEANVMIDVMATHNTRALANIDSVRIRTRRQSQFEIMTTMMQRMASGELHTIGTNYPCHALAQEAEMSLREYEDFLYGATLADRENPIQCWQKVHDDQERLVNWLKGKRQVVVHSPYADLSLSIEERGFVNGSGQANMPCGEIFTSPVENSANGWIEFNFPVIYAGKEADGVRIELKDGKVAKASAQKGEEFLLEMLESDAGARYLGEFAIGTNYGIQRFTRNMLFDEKIGGTIHLALGQGFSEVGGKNKSSLHWDMLSDMRKDSEILIDGELFYKDGKFQI